MKSPVLRAAWAAIASACVVVAAVAHGGEGAAGAGVGVVVVGLFFASTPLLLSGVSRHAPGVSVLAALMLYGTKVLGLLVLFAVLLGPDAWGEHLHGGSLGVTVIVASLAWTTLAIVGDRRGRHLVYDLDNNE